MNVALIHDKLYIKTFWEKKIQADCNHSEDEEKRKAQSALSKLRQEWQGRLETRTKHLKKLNEDYLRRSKTT